MNGVLRRFLWPAVALLAVGALALTLLVALRSPPDAVGEPVTVASGTTAPALTGRTLAGADFDLTALRGQIVLVNVFASWCEPCRTELPLLVDAERRWSGRGLRVVGLDVRDGPDAARALLDETGAGTLTVVADPRGDTAVSWGVRGVPESFLVDRDGRVRQRAQGAITAAWLERWLPPLLAP
ncbi:TlpA disulfide reductase family protein [Micromonospora sp. NPDC049679]|uniref:TlpA family protein disulfide reductase n=1 Tax=Micromonospora sp. NPDC049679 TaxID=3155920 RepID=UPI0033CA5186